MFQVDGLILVGAVLLLFAVASSKFSARLGVPVLVVFVGIGMLAGSEGIGGIAFEHYELAHGLGTVALALILFDGGLRTSVGSFRGALGPALGLATLGVLITATATGVAAAWILGLPILTGLLLGSIVGSTDAAAVFAVLRGQGVGLEPRVGSILEIESGSNDPMAIFLTVGILQVLSGQVEPGWGLLSLLFVQMSVGAAVGLATGRLATELINRIQLDAAGLYGVLTVATGLLAYGLAASLGGSGFLSVYLAGIVLGNSRLVFKRGIFLFGDGMAWLAQIAMFTMLGLLSFPSRLLEVAGPALLVAAVLTLVARPLAVFTVLLPFGFSVREKLFVSWVGLRGAVPIILAIYPFLFGIPESQLIFNAVFFVVLVSVTLQGWTLPRVAAGLGLERPVEPEATVTLEITSLKQVNSDIVEYTIGRGSKAVGMAVRELALPDGAVLAMIARDADLVTPRGGTRVLAGDHVFVVIKPEVRALVDRLFSREPHALAQPLPALEFPLTGATTVADLRDFYGIELEERADCTLAALLERELGDRVRDPAATMRTGHAELRAREVRADGTVEWVGLVLHDARDG